jgi:hypothetical protein
MLRALRPVGTGPRLPGELQPAVPSMPGKGTQLAPDERPPDTPVIDAGLDPETDPGSAVTAVEGDGHPAEANAHVAEQGEQLPASVQGTVDLAGGGHPGSGSAAQTDPADSTPGTAAATAAPVRENHAAAAATHPDAVAGEDEFSSPFDNGVLLTELATGTTVANTG